MVSYEALEEFALQSGINVPTLEAWVNGVVFSSYMATSITAGLVMIFIAVAYWCATRFDKISDKMSGLTLDNCDYAAYDNQRTGCSVVGTISVCLVLVTAIIGATHVYDLINLLLHPDAVLLEELFQQFIN